MEKAETKFPRMMDSQLNRASAQADEDASRENKVKVTYRTTRTAKVVFEA